MSHANLTARYRPQTFASLAGQETVRAILSRAAAEDRVAPAYLFSGTRGVGKTTLARIFAKALNCEHAPGPEPCNECERCRQITAGTAVDVVEIDGASNRGIDDVRRLKEVVGYAPMDGRYKVFIIDEAHMLSRDAFNALLKTLEEPPARVTFIMATTEAHKFPATILSRCQHFVFKRLPEAELEAHLASVLQRENVAFEEAAVRLIARRAAGSVRDGMSLLGQVLALGGETLTEDDTRRVLGLAGQELFFTLFTHLREGDTLAITALVREMLDSGLDLGFFLRELAASWRILFMLGQAGDAAIPLLDIPAAEAARWKETAASFDAAHVHAAWQMTLDGQRRVLTSLEPSLALELLLLNLALLPRLLSMEQLSSRVRKSTPPSGGGNSGTGGTAPASGAAGSRGAGFSPSAAGAASASGSVAAPVSTMPSGFAGASSGVQPGSAGRIADVPVNGTAGSSSPRAGGREASMPRSPHGDDAQEDALPAPAGAEPAEPVAVPETPAALPLMGPEQADDLPFAGLGMPLESESPVPEGFDDIDIEEATSPDTPGTAPRTAQPGPGVGVPFSWERFVAYCSGREDVSPGFLSVLRSQNAEDKADTLEITPDTAFSSGQIEGRIKSGYLAGLLRNYCGREFVMRLLPPAKKLRRMTELREEMRTHPSIMLLEKQMGARMIDCGRLGS